MNSLGTQTARALRKNSTPAEMLFWKLVRNRGFYNLKFLRQHPIYFQYEDRERFFVADFYCAEQKLVVEIDGSVHQNQIEYDSLRTFLIHQMGIHVLRFKNEDLNKIEDIKVILEIYLGLKERK